MMLPNGVLSSSKTLTHPSLEVKNKNNTYYRVYLSRGLSFLRQRRVCCFRDFNNLNISIKPLPRNVLSKGVTICINFQLLKTIIWFTLSQHTTDLFVAQSLIINICSVSFCNYKKTVLILQCAAFLFSKFRRAILSLIVKSHEHCTTSKYQSIKARILHLPYITEYKSIQE